jgi:hypothetical protein
MTPTNRLRFVERTESRREPNSGSYWVKVRVLQQWWAWEKEPDWPGEWRDVPLEEEA